MFGIGLGPLPWFVVVELFPSSVRSLAVSLTQGLNWLLCSIMIFMFVPLVNLFSIGWVYFIYSFLMFIAFFFGIFYFPIKNETIESSSNIIKPFIE